jgi:hypothetical protein
VPAPLLIKEIITLYLTTLSDKLTSFDATAFFLVLQDNDTNVIAITGIKKNSFFMSSIIKM